MKRSIIIVALLFAIAACETDQYDAQTEAEMGVDTTEAGTTDLGTETDVFGEWDTDANTELSEEEFRTGLTSEGVFGQWDENADTYLDENEVGGGLFETWDANNDMALDENEFNTAAGDWFNEGQYGTFSEWDTDTDGQLTEEEFSTRFSETGLYDEWDADTNAQLTEDEFGTALYGTWAGDDDVLSRDEYDAWNPYWDWL